MDNPVGQIYSYLDKVFSQGLDALLQSKNIYAQTVLFNRMTRTLVGEEFFQNWLKENLRNRNVNLLSVDTSQLEETALKNLERIDVILSVGDLNTYVGKIGYLISQAPFEIPFLYNLNKFNSKNILSELSGDTMNLLRLYNKIDCIIYSEAMKLRQSRNISDDLEELSKQNRVSVLNFSQSIFAKNIHPREINPPKYSVWTGYDGASTIYIKRNGIDSGFINILVTNYIDKSQISSVKITVNGALTSYLSKRNTNTTICKS